jgi:hypothetical protein
MTVENFINKNLKFAQYATEEQKINEGWEISGVLYKYSNQEFKFDVRSLKKLDSGDFGKTGKTSTKADKTVLETSTEWVILDIEEINKYIKKNNIKILKLDNLLSELEWNIVIKK